MMMENQLKKARQIWGRIGNVTALNPFLFVDCYTVLQTLFQFLEYGQIYYFNTIHPTTSRSSGCIPHLSP